MQGRCPYIFSGSPAVMMNKLLVFKYIITRNKKWPQIFFQLRTFQELYFLKNQLLMGQIKKVKNINYICPLNNKTRSYTFNMLFYSFLFFFTFKFILIIFISANSPPKANYTNYAHLVDRAAGRVKMLNLAFDATNQSFPDPILLPIPISNC